MQIEGKLFPTKRSASAQKLVPLAAPLPEETCYAKTLFLLFRSAYILFYYYRCLVLISIAILLECKQYFIHCIVVKIYDFLFYVSTAVMC